MRKSYYIRILVKGDFFSYLDGSGLNRVVLRKEASDHGCAVLVSSLTMAGGGEEHGAKEAQIIQC